MLQMNNRITKISDMSDLLIQFRDKVNTIIDSNVPINLILRIIKLRARRIMFTKSLESGILLASNKTKLKKSEFTFHVKSPRSS